MLRTRKKAIQDLRKQENAGFRSDHQLVDLIKSRQMETRATKRFGLPQKKGDFGPAPFFWALRISALPCRAIAFLLCGFGVRQWLKPMETDLAA